MKNYAKVHPVNYNQAAATRKKLNYKKVVRNPDAQLYLALKRVNKIPLKKGIFTGHRVLTYKEWLRTDRNPLRLAV